MNKCKRMTVVAVGVDDNWNMVEAVNYNLNECTGQEGNCGCVHAEMALLEKMPHPKIVFVSHSPCINCAIALVAAGVRHVSYVKEYRRTDGITYLLRRGVSVSKIPNLNSLCRRC